MEKIVSCVLELIAARGRVGIPSGHLYVELQTVLGQSWTLDIHNACIQLLVQRGLVVQEPSFLLRAVS